MLKRSLILAVVVLAGTTGSLAQAPTSDVSGIAVAAVRALSSPGALGVAGLVSLDEVQSIQAAPPIPVRDVRADLLATFIEGSDPQSILADNGTVVVPIYIGNDVRCAVELQDVQGVWKIRSIGASSIIGLIESTRHSVVADAAIDAQAHVLIRIPAIQKMFVGGPTPKGLLLFEIRHGNSVSSIGGAPATSQFAALAGQARAVH